MKYLEVIVMLPDGKESILVTVIERLVIGGGDGREWSRMAGIEKQQGDAAKWFAVRR